MSGSLGDMGNLLKQAQTMQRELDRVREELRGATVEGTAGGGAVRVVISGDRRVQSMEIAQEVVDSGDKAALEDLVCAALRDGMDRAQKLAEESLGQVTGGIQLPGLF